MSKMETISKVSLKLTSWINFGAHSPPLPSPNLHSPERAKANIHLKLCIRPEPANANIDNDGAAGKTFF